MHKHREPGGFRGRPEALGQAFVFLSIGPGIGNHTTAGVRLGGLRRTATAGRPSQPFSPTCIPRLRAGFPANAGAAKSFDGKTFLYNSVRTGLPAVFSSGAALPQ